MTQQEFIDSIKPKAKELYTKYGIFPSLTIAQACLESAFGKSAPGNNLFGFKWYEGCGYDFQLLWTKEYVNGAYVSVQAKFRKYNSIFDSLDDYGKLIGTTKRYAPVLLCKDYLCACKQVKACGYATGLNYDLNLIKLIEQYKLYELDNLMDKQLTANFKYSEFWDHGVEPPTGYYINILTLAKELQKVRDACGRPITINSGWRTKQHNLEVGGASSSQHLTGKAADCRISGLEPKFANLYFARYGTGLNGLGIAVNYTHVDIRDLVNNAIIVWTY